MWASSHTLAYRLRFRKWMLISQRLREKDRDLIVPENRSYAVWHARAAATTPPDALARALAVLGISKQLA
ncbi:MAG: hypothetical protein E2O37_01980 [Proteobacteria bacterium]|nr:MAG: hypothetical protein E2O37_01980 [Pseudomonadota bacterium]